MTARWASPRRGMVGAPGLEPGTSALSGRRSSRLSYAPEEAPDRTLITYRRQTCTAPERALCARKLPLVFRRVATYATARSSNIPPGGVWGSSPMRGQSKIMEAPPAGRASMSRSVGAAPPQMTTYEKSQVRMRTWLWS